MLSQMVEEVPKLPGSNVHAENETSDKYGNLYEVMIRHRLDKMLCTSSVPQDGVSTQRCTQIERTSTPTTWTLKEPHKQRLVGKHCQIASQRRNGSKEKVACECGSARHEGTLIACDGCDYWKHQHCYGLEASLTPEVFFCYFCLAETSDDSVYSGLMQLAKQRRTLWIMRDKGMPSSCVSLGKLLNCNERQARAVVKELKCKGLLKASSGNSQSQSLSLGQYYIDEKAFRMASEPGGAFHHFAMISQFYVQVPVKAITHRSDLVSQGKEAGLPETIAKLNTLIDEHIDENQSTRPSDTTDGETDELRAYSPANLGILKKFLTQNSATARQEQTVDHTSSPPVTPLKSSRRKRLQSKEPVTPRGSKRRALSTRSPIDCSWQE